MLLLFRDQWKSGLDCFPSKRVYYSCIMHERVARSSLHRVFFLFSRDTKEHSTRLSTRKLREIAAGWMDVYAIFFLFLIIHAFDARAKDAPASFELINFEFFFIFELCNSGHLLIKVFLLIVVLSSFHFKFYYYTDWNNINI